VVGKDAAIVTLGGLVQFDGEVLDGGCFELLGHTLLDIPRGLAHLELAVVCGIGNGVGVDAGAGFGFGGEDVLDGLTHRHFRQWRHRPTGHWSDPSVGPPFR
jgi:hypothetical protein